MTVIVPRPLSVLIPQLPQFLERLPSQLNAKLYGPRQQPSVTVSLGKQYGPQLNLPSRVLLNSKLRL